MTVGYGNSGAVRFKPYGIEYRVPDNTWFLLGHNDILRTMYKVCDWSTHHLNYADTYVKKDPLLVDLIRGCVDNYQPSLAKDLLTHLDIPVRA